MKNEFEKWFYARTGPETYPAYRLQETAWNAARDKILEILKENVQTYDSGRGPNFDWRFLDEDVIKEIEKL